MLRRLPGVAAALSPAFGAACARAAGGKQGYNRAAFDGFIAKWQAHPQ
jgi:hypothetical protein